MKKSHKIILGMASIFVGYSIIDPGWDFIGVHNPWPNQITVPTPPWYGLIKKVSTNILPTSANQIVPGEDCKIMEKYFNENIGRSDTKFSNYEGQIARREIFALVDFYCGGGVMIQTLPTGTKTCSTFIYYNPKTSKISWLVEDASTDCFVSQ